MVFGRCAQALSHFVNFPTKISRRVAKIPAPADCKTFCVAFAGRPARFRPGTVIAHRRAMNSLAANALPILPPTSHFETLGGQAGVERLVNAFYRQMDTRADAQGIRAMHEPDLASTNAVLVLYLCEWLGGPKDYSAQRGHPRLRMRHAGFSIGVAQRDAWLTCMRAALDDVGATPELQSALMTAFFKTADWMRNTGPQPSQP